ncbi:MULTISPECIES: HAD family hydrolase [Streptomyces]|uniref:HAD family hydrolase n=1 Tax=Streptomyces dengpaensis TaxID=2049881 RepID=A0ABM6SUL8_9ACTN|nr:MULTISPECIES: HAD hydrolase-like protein [Streptomyces]AVH58419.1 HAD family hydrolase [Streptomyces dengpaensis]PIB06092.1 phosphatase [Streptomyces sp. HG99]
MGTRPLGQVGVLPSLFHDNDAIIGATNAAFAELGLEPITLERYRALYCVPVPKFYERLIGRLPTDDEWQIMDETFHRYYAEHRKACELTEGVPALLAGWGSAGNSQSILSMYGHDELVPLVRGFGIEPHFIRVDGRTGPSGGSKAEHMVRHVGALAGVEPSRVVVIGDAADDALAAGHVGAQAVLYTGGSHGRASLEEAGVPVVDSLAEAVEEAERLAA